MADSSKTLEILVRLKDLASKEIAKLRTGVGGVGTAVGTAGRSIKAFGGGASRVFGNLKNQIFSLQGMIIGLGLGLTAKGFLDVAASFEDMEIKLDVLTKGKGRQTLEELNAWALKMPVNTQEAVSSFTRMLAMGLDPTIEKLGILVDVASIFGDDVLSRVSRQLGQMASSARVSSEDLNTIAETGLNVRKYLTAAFGSIEDLQKKVKSGAIDIKDAINVIWKGMGEEYAGAAAKAQNTWRGLWNTFVSFLVEIQRKVMAAGVFEELKNTMRGINEQLERWINNNLILIYQKVPEYIEKTKKAVKSLWDQVQKIYNLFSGLPSDIAGIAGYGLLGRILWGGPAGFLLAAFGVGKAIAGLVNQAGYNVEDNVTKLETRIASLKSTIASLGEIDTPGKQKYFDGLLAALKLAEDSLDVLKKKRADAAFGKEFKLPQDEFTGVAAPDIKEKPKTTRPPKPLDQRAVLGAEMKDLQTQTSRILSQLDYMYSEGLTKTQAYYGAKKLLLEENSASEIALLEKTRDLETDKTKLFAANQNIKAGKEKLTDELINLEREYQAALKIEKEKEVTAEKEKNDKIASLQSSMYSDMKADSEGWLEFKAAQLAKQHGIYREAFKGNAELELAADQWLKDQQLALTQEYLAASSSAYSSLLNMSLATAEAIGQAFSNYFFDLMTGKFNTLREVAYNALLSIQRIASDVLGQMATDWLKKQAVEFMSTTKAAIATQTKVAQLTKEAAAQAKISLMLIAQQGPVYALAAAYTVLAAAKAAAGMAGGGGGGASTIRGGAGGGYGFAEGGEIPGRSPHSKADNIPIWATGRSGDKPGEFMQPVKTVQHYGKTVMEGIRRMVYPKEVFSSEVVTDKTFQQHSSKITDSFKTTKDIYKSLLEDTMKVFTTRDMTKELVEKIIQPIKSVKPNIVRHLYKFIGAQRKSEGGSIVGSSPTPTSDNIPIWATAKEFMQPVKSVQHYGRDVMEGLRTRSIPKEIFSALRLPTINIPRPRMSYAGGGEIAAVRSSAENTGKEGKERELTILNVPDPSMVGQYLASADGMDMLVNIMSSRAQTFRRILF